MKVRLIVSCVVVMLSVAAGHASPIYYTVSTTGSGSLGSTSFTNQSVTITLAGDTANVYSSNGAYRNAGTYTTVSIGGGPDSFFTDVARLFVSQGNHGAGIGIDFWDILDTQSNLFDSYNATTPIGPITGHANYNQNRAYNTADGSFVLTSIGDASIFTASATPPPSTAVTPEPSSIVLLGTGLIGAFATLRRKLAI